MRASASPLLLLLLAVSAVAHPFLQNSMWVVFAPDRVRLAVNVSLKEVLVARGLSAGEDDAYEAAAVNAAAEEHREYVARHLQLSLAGRELSGRVTSLTPPPIFTSAEKTFFQYELEYLLPGPPPANVTFRQDMLREFPYSAGQAWDVSYVVRVKREGSEEVSSWLLRHAQPTDLPTGWEATSALTSAPVKKDGWRTFREYLQQFFAH